MTLPLVSVVVLNYNGKGLLEQFLPSVKNLVYPNKEIIIVDNASTDDSVSFVKNNYPDFKIIQNSINLGTAESSNTAIKEAKGKYIFWVSNDMQLDSNILKHLVDCCEANERIGIVTAKMLRIKNDTPVNQIDSMGADIDIFGFPISRGINEQDKGQYNNRKEIFFAFGGAMFVRKDLLSIIGGYDSNYFTLSDDIDLCWRAHLLGYKVVVEPKAFLYHKVSATLSKTHNRAEKRYISERNTLRTLLKNYSLGFLFLILPLYFIILLLEIVFFAIILKFEISAAGFRAVFWNAVNFGDTLKERKKVQSFRKINDLELMRLMKIRCEKLRIFFDFLKNHKKNNWQEYFGD